MRGYLLRNHADIGIRLYDYEGSALTLECRWGFNGRESIKRRSEPSQAYHTTPRRCLRPVFGLPASMYK